MSRPVLSLEALADWLRKQPGETEYDICDSKNCLITRWLRGIGIKAVRTIVTGRNSAWVGRWGWKHPAPNLHDLFNIVAAQFPSTYAAALSRAEALLTKGGEAHRG